MLKSPGPETWVPWVLLLCAAALYLSLGQGTLHGDAPGILLMVHAGHAFDNPTHYLHGPLLLGLWSLLAPLGVSLHQAGVALSAGGAAVGVLWVYYASRMLLGGWQRPVLIAAVVATCPATMFYGTVVELHGLFLAFFGVVALGLANLALRPTMANAILLGVAMGFAALAHASAHLLPVVALLLCPMLSSWRGTGVEPKRWLALIGVGALTHVAFVGITLGLLRLVGLGGASIGSAADHVLGDASTYWYRLADSPTVFLHEWLLPFFPVSLACAAAVVDAHARRMLGALAVLLVVYVVPTAFLVDVGTEFGAYLLPLAWPAAVLAARMFSARWLIVFAALGLCIAVPRIHAHDTVDKTRRAAQVARELWPEGELFILPVTKSDLELCFVGLPNAKFRYLAPLALTDEETVRKLLPQVEVVVDNALAYSRGVLLTKAGRDALLSEEAAAKYPGAAVIAEHLFKTYEATAIRRPGLSGWTLARR